MEDLGLRMALDALLDRLPTDRHGRFNASEVIHAAWWDAGWTQYLRDAGWVGGRDGGRRCRKALVEEGDDPCLVWLRRDHVVRLLPTRLPEKGNWWKSQLGPGGGTTVQGGELVKALAPHKRCETKSGGCTLLNKFLLKLGGSHLWLLRAIAILVCKSREICFCSFSARYFYLRLRNYRDCACFHVCFCSRAHVFLIPRLCIFGCSAGGLRVPP